MKRVLHITNWYPNPWHEHEGIFVKEQFNLFSQVTDSIMVNVQVQPGYRWFQFRYFKYSEKESGYFILCKVKSQKIIELLTSLLLLWVLNREKVNKYDLLHVHIAYPLLTYFFLWKKWLTTKVLISEHWSAYHYNFYLPKNTRKLERIKIIFRQQIPVVAVSTVLLQDIRHFSGADDFRGEVIPNVIDQEYFCFDEQVEIPVISQFFMVNVWRDIKNPFPLLEAFNKLVVEGIELRLILGGYGPLLEKMQLFVEENGLNGVIKFPGVMTKSEIAKALMESDAYLFSSKYETFSVACAQALCCGVPLIGPPIPAILEYAGDKDMITVHENNATDWEVAIRKFMEKRNDFCRSEIAERAANLFSTEVLKVKYSRIVDEISSKRPG